MKKCSFFLSSTFNDMQTERDIMRFQVEDNINNIVREKEVEVSFIDLRWGVHVDSVEENEYDKKVLEICLNEIKKTKPYFIVFLGERYGWIPTKDDVQSVAYQAGIEESYLVDKSVTEIEIKYATNTFSDLSKCLFYFRRPVDFGKDDSARKKYVSQGDEAEKLNSIKEYLVEHFPNQIRQYSASWDEKAQSFVVEQDFEQRLMQDVIQLMAEEYEEIEGDEFFRKQRTINAIIEKNAGEFLGRKELLGMLLRDINESKNTIFAISSEDANGKTLLLSKLAKELSLEGKFVLPFFSAKGEEILDYKGLLIYFLNVLGVEECEDKTNEELLLEFRQTVNRISLEREIYIVIDDLERIVKNREHLNLINTFAYSRVKFIVAIRKENYLIQYVSAMGGNIVDLGKYEQEDVEEIVVNYFNDRSKKVGPNLLEAIIKRGKNFYSTVADPLYLSMLLQTINNLSSAEFKEINRRTEENGDSFSANIEKLQIEMVNGLGDNLAQVIAQHVSKSRNKILDLDVFIEILHLAPNGIYDRQVEFIFNELGLEFSQYTFSLFLKEFAMFIVMDEVGHWHFSRESIYEILDLKDGKFYREKILASFVKYYEQMSDKEEQNSYLLKYYLALKEYDRAYKFLEEGAKYKERAIILAFAKIIEEDKNYLQHFVNLKKIDKQGILSFLYRRTIVLCSDERKAKKILNVIYSEQEINEIILTGEGKGKLYNNLVGYALMCFKKQKYIEALKVATEIIEKFGRYQTVFFNNYEIKLIEVLSAVNLGKKSDHEGYYRLISACEERLLQKKDNVEEFDKNKKQAKKLLTSLAASWEGLKGTRDGTFFFHEDINDLLETGYFNEDEKAYWISVMFAYSPDPFDREQTKLRYIADEDIIKEYLEERRLLRGKLEKYINSEQSDKEMVYKCCMNLSKYYDESYRPNFTYTKKAEELAEERFKNKITVNTVSDYCVALERSACEMIYRREDSSVLSDKLIKVAKLNVLTNPCVESYDRINTAYNLCAYNNQLSREDKQKQGEYEKERKKIVYKKENFDWEQHKKLMNVLYAIISVIFVCGIYFGFNILELPSESVKTICLFLFVGVVSGFALSKAVEKIVYRKGFVDLIFIILGLLVFVVGLVYILTFDMDDETAKRFSWNYTSRPENVYYFVKYGGKEIYIYRLQIFSFLISPIAAGVVSLRSVKKNKIGLLCFSKIENIKEHVIINKERKERKQYNILMCFPIINMIIYAVKYFLVKDLKYMALLTRNIPLITLILGLATTIVSLLLILLSKIVATKSIRKQRSKAFRDHLWQ